VRINAAGVALIRSFEQLRLKAYLCPAGKWTIGYGHTGDVVEGRWITAHQADAILDVDLDKFERAVELAVSRPVNENQFSALVSFAFNVGVKAFCESTLLHHVRRGDFTAAGHEFSRWVYAGKVRLPGLIRRREAEAALFRTPV
jgi:lysozyme